MQDVPQLLKGSPSKQSAIAGAGDHQTRPAQSDGGDNKSLAESEKFDETDDDYAYFDNLETSPLNPPSLPDPIGLFPDYFVKGGPVPLALKSDSPIHKKYWTIKDGEKGEVLFKATGRATTMSEKVFTDKQGREICILKRVKPAYYGDYYLESMDGRRLLEFQKPGKLRGKAITAAFTDHLSGQTRTLRIDAHWRKGRGIVTLDGMFLTTVARAEDTFVLSLTPTYKMTVPDGMDLALMAMLSTVFACWGKEYNDVFFQGGNM